jgi:hypothetical protein
VADLQSSDDETEEEGNSASTTSIVNKSSFQSDAGPDDSFMTVQKDRTNNSASADTKISGVAVKCTNSDAAQKTSLGRFASRSKSNT